MKDKRIWDFKRRVEEDNLISAATCRMLLRIASWRYCTKNHPADAEFGLSAPEIASWYDYDSPEAIKDPETIYAWIRQAVFNRYMIYCGKKGCPGKSCYRLDLDYKPEPLTLFNWAADQGSMVTGKTPALVTGKTPALVTGKTRRQDAKKNPPPIIKYSLREEMYKTKGKKFSGGKRRQVTKRGRVGSLRSTGTAPLPLGDGQDASAVPTASAGRKQSHAGDKALSPPDNLSTASGTGGTNPPGAHGRKAVRSLSPEHLLFFARNRIATGKEDTLTEEHVIALLEAGDTLPVCVAEKFAAVCERFNPVKA
ncbi:MAG TPA: hypothetical protein PKA41_11105 [Verrucomicrobiota bacterium]|nr:hypothetical protein [Verrucomicrobiota bacterium]